MILLIILLHSLGYVCSFEDSDFYDDGYQRSVTNTQWMASLNDSLPLSAISVPGTHDSVSFYGGDLVQTQSWALIGQLWAGIRFLDIRCRHYMDTLPIYHGPVFQYTYFDTILRDVVEFLTAFPSEAIIMRVKGEYIAEGNNETMVETVSRYLRMFPSDKFWLSNRIPSVGESRGKIVIVQDFHGPILGLQYRDMRIEEHWEVWSLFFWDIDAKWGYINGHLETTNSGDNSVMYMTFINGSGLMAYPYAVAWRINRKLIEYLEDHGDSLHRIGIIVMDYPGGRLIEKIIEVNF